MKRFNKFTEDVDRIAALRARQKAAVSKFKSGSETPSPKKTRESCSFWRCC